MTHAAAQLVLIAHRQRIMAAHFGIHLAVAPGDEARAREATDRCVAWLAEVDDRLTRFDAASELCQLNAAAGTWHSVSKLLYDAVAQSLAAARASDGLFDPTLLTLLKVLGYDRDYREIAGRDVGVARPGRRRAAHAGGWRGIELDRARRRIRLPAGAELDLGGIAKGWAADVALTRFFGTFANVLIDAAGDMAVRGGPEEGGLWALGIGDPLAGSDASADRHAAVLTLGRGGLATSGATERWWSRGGERQHHLIDPRSERAARVWVNGDATDADGSPLIATASALAPSAAHAEVAAKVALLRGYPDALRQVERAWQDGGGKDPRPYGDAGVALVLVLGTGQVVCSAHLDEYLATLGGGGEIWLD